APEDSPGAAVASARPRRPGGLRRQRLRRPDPGPDLPPRRERRARAAPVRSLARAAGALRRETPAVPPRAWVLTPAQTTRLAARGRDSAGSDRGVAAEEPPRVPGFDREGE